MSANYTWHLLIPRGRLDSRSLDRVVEMLSGQGLTSLRGPGGHLWAMNADGSGTVVFDSPSAAISWIAQEGGLVSFVGLEEVDELSLSVHKVDGMLPVELGLFGDSPEFDEVRLDIGELAARNRGLAWQFFDRAVLAAGALCGAVFAWCIDESSLETMGQFSVHRSIAFGELPALPGAAIALPRESAMLPQLLAMRQDARATLSERQGWVELRPYPCLWSALELDPAPDA